MAGLAQKLDPFKRRAYDNRQGIAEYLREHAKPKVDPPALVDLCIPNNYRDEFPAQSENNQKMPSSTAAFAAMIVNSPAEDDTDFVMVHPETYSNFTAKKFMTDWEMLHFSAQIESVAFPKIEGKAPELAKLLRKGLHMVLDLLEGKARA